MSPTGRAVAALAVAALSGLVIGPLLAGAAVLALVAATLVDALAVRGRPSVERKLPRVLSRRVPAEVSISATPEAGSRLDLRQVVPPDLVLDPDQGSDRLDASLTARRRGRHVLPAVAVRARGPLGLGAWYHEPGEPAEVLVYPDVAAARRLALAVRQGRRSPEGRRARGQLGLGTEFESVREWLPDDDIRHVNWRATARTGRPMTNRYRIEQDRDVVLVVDAGRLMASPLDDGNRLDAALDAAAAVALVADELGDRCGAVAFAGSVVRHLAPRRAGGEAVIRSLFDLQAEAGDADYEAAFAAVGRVKRAWVLVLSDLLDDAASRSLIGAVPTLARRHALALASVEDPDLRRLTREPPEREVDAYAAVAAVDLLEARERAAAQIRRAGADVIEAPPRSLPAACVRAYVRAKSRARL